MDDIYEEIVKLRSRGDRAAMATVISTSGSTPRGQGAKMVIRQDGSILGSVGGSVLEARVREQAQQVMAQGEPQMVECDLTGTGESGMICGGTARVYIEPIIPKETVYIFGGGHIAYTLARMGRMVGFRIVVIDDREEYANAQRFPDADQTIAGEYRQVLSQMRVNAHSYLVILTRGHAFDQTVLEWAVGTNARYIGMVGSRRKIRKVYDNLISSGIPESTLQQVHAPIGLNIKAETPEEIAVSILAELIEVRRCEHVKEPSSCPV